MWRSLLHFSSHCLIGQVARDIGGSLRSTCCLRSFHWFDVSAHWFRYQNSSVHSVLSIHSFLPGLLQSNASSASNDNTPQSILLNVCGRLLLLQQERGGSSLVLQKTSKKNTTQPVTFLPPVMIAAWVESIWTISHQNSTNPYLSNALWLCCGLRGMNVWLPLYRKLDEPRFQSHRIMLTFGLTIYPLGRVGTICSLLVGSLLVCL